MPWGAAIAVGGSLLASSLQDDNGAEGFNDASAQAARDQAALAKEQFGIYKENYLPVEKSLIAEANAAGSPEEQERAAGQANADVTQGFDRARRQQDASFSARGIDSVSPMRVSADNSLNFSEAASRIGAENTARDREKNLGWDKRFGIASLGRNIPSQVSSSLSDAGRTFGILGNNATNSARQDRVDTGYAIAPLVNALSKNAKSWFGSSGTEGGIATGGYAAGSYGGASFGGTDYYTP